MKSVLFAIFALVWSVTLSFSSLGVEASLLTDEMEEAGVDFGHGESKMKTIKALEDLERKRIFKRISAEDVVPSSMTVGELLKREDGDSRGGKKRELRGSEESSSSLSFLNHPMEDEEQQRKLPYICPGISYPVSGVGVASAVTFIIEDTAGVYPWFDCLSISCNCNAQWKCQAGYGCKMCCGTACYSFIPPAGSGLVCRIDGNPFLTGPPNCYDQPLCGY